MVTYGCKKEYQTEWQIRHAKASAGGVFPNFYYNLLFTREPKKELRCLLGYLD